MLSASGFNALRGYDRRFWALLAGFMASSMGFAMIVPFVSLYFHEELGVSMAWVGGFFLCTAVVRSLFQGFAGDLSDRVGRARLMVWGQASRAAVFVVMAWVVFQGFGFWIAGLVLLVSYIAGAFYQPVANAAVTDLVPAHRRVEAYAITRIAHNLGWGVGPMLGGLVAEAGYGWLFVAGAATSFFSAWLVWRHVSETWVRNDTAPLTRVRWNDFLAVRDDPAFMMFCGISLFVFVVMAQWLSTLPVDASNRLGVSPRDLGLVFGLNGVMVVLLQFPVTRALRRVTTATVLAVGSIAYGLAFLTVPLARDLWGLALCMAAITLAELIYAPASTAMVSYMAPAHRVGRYMGVFGLTNSFGWSGGPFLGGVLLDRWGPHPWVVWGVIAGVALAAGLGYLATRPLYPSDPA